MRKTIISLVVAVASLVPVGILADGMPPDARKAASGGGEASATRVTQADLQADAPDQYTVVKGDTLWGLAGRFLKDPWKWPQIWNMNREQIRDPHWIYPGDVIRLDRTGAYPSLSLGGPGGTAQAGIGGADVAASNVVKYDPRVRVEPLQTSIPTIPGSVIGPFLTQPLVIESNALDNAPTILALEERRVIVSEGNSLYADRIGANDGVNWQVFRPGSTYRDPETGEILGFEARYLGDARVRRYGDPSTATALDITKSREEINRGDRLAPARETSFISYMPRSPSKQLKGIIMSVDGGVSEVGQYQVITINRGSRDGIESGHVLATYRRGGIIGGNEATSSLLDTVMLRGWDSRPVPVVPDPPYAAQSTDTKAAPDSRAGPLNIPDERNGLVIVFRVFEKMSYAMIMRSSKPIYVGDVVQTP
jgi:LysM domain-containing protein